MNQPVVCAGCMDCDLQTRHTMVSEAAGSAAAHQFNEPNHRLLVSDTNGWHRYYTGSEA